MVMCNTVDATLILDRGQFSSFCCLLLCSFSADFDSCSAYAACVVYCVPSLRACVWPVDVLRLCALHTSWLLRRRRDAYHKVRPVVVVAACSVVCLWVTSVRCAKTPELIKMPYGCGLMGTQATMTVLGGVPDPFEWFTLARAVTCPRSVFETLFAKRMRLRPLATSLLHCSNLLNEWCHDGYIGIAVVFVVSEA